LEDTIAVYVTFSWLVLYKLYTSSIMLIVAAVLQHRVQWQQKVSHGSRVIV